MKSEIHIGPAGWSYPDWQAIVYPRRTPRSFDHLAYLASYFNLIEINSTFYRVPSRDTCRRWVERVEHERGFRFTAKAFQDLTHKRTGVTKVDVHTYARAIAPLHESGRLNAVLLQFPWSFRCNRDARDYVSWLAEALSPLPVAVEVRHASWSQPAALDVFRRGDVTMCSVDQPLIGESLDARSCYSGRAGAYVRLHGHNHAQWFNPRATRDSRYDYLYSSRELERWAERVRTAASTAKRVNVVLNNHFRGQAVANAIELLSLLQARAVAAPPGVLATYPQLTGRAVPDQRIAPAASRDEPRQRDLFDQEDE